MKYKIEIQFDFQGLDKDEIRECKLQIIEMDMITCMESEYPLHIPNKGETLTLGEEDYVITKISHCITKNYYTTILLVKNLKISEIINEKEKLKEYKRRKLEHDLFKKMVL